MIDKELNISGICFEDICVYKRSHYNYVKK